MEAKDCWRLAPSATPEPPVGVHLFQTSCQEKERTAPQNSLYRWVKRCVFTTGCKVRRQLGPVGVRMPIIQPRASRRKGQNGVLHPDQCFR